MTIKVLLVTLLLAGLGCFGLQASTISGSFDLTGTVTVSADTITWTSPGGANTALITNATGSFASLDNTYATISNLTNPPEEVGVMFTDTAFIGFQADPGLGMLDINFIAPGTDGIAGCTSSPPAAGQTCTPEILQNGGTAPGPFNLQNQNPCPMTNPNCGLPLQTAISWNFSGDALSAGSTPGTWSGAFTSQNQFEPFQSILADLATNGSVTNTFSEGTLVVSVTATPEGGTLALVGLGLVFLSRGLGRWSKKLNA